jgi:hypothetical protein
MCFPTWYLPVITVTTESGHTSTIRRMGFLSRDWSQSTNSSGPPKPGSSPNRPNQHKPPRRQIMALILSWLATTAAAFYFCPPSCCCCFCATEIGKEYVQSSQCASPCKYINLRPITCLTVLERLARSCTMGSLFEASTIPMTHESYESRP